MLILSRSTGRSVIIGGNIKVTVLGFNGKHQVRLGIDAPKDVSVHREEVHEKIQNGLEQSHGE